jgi:abhydrolase domain-containing protein 14
MRSTTRARGLFLLVASLVGVACPSCGEEPRPDDGKTAPSKHESATRPTSEPAEAERSAKPREPAPPPTRTDEPAAPPRAADHPDAVTIVHPQDWKAPEPGADVPTPTDEDRWMECEQYDFQFDGHNLRALRTGKPGGREVLLLHGARFTSRNWLDLHTLEKLAKNGCRAIAIDLPGFGRSADVPRKPAEFLHRVLPFLDLKKPVVLFPSMSGDFVWPFVTAHREEVAGLVAVAPVGIDEWAEKIRGLDVPALLLWGERDKVVPLEQSVKLEKLLPKSTRHVIPDADHPCYVDAPDEFHRALLDFLKKLDAK